MRDKACRSPIPNTVHTARGHARDSRSRPSRGQRSEESSILIRELLLLPTNSWRVRREETPTEHWLSLSRPTAPEAIAYSLTNRTNRLNPNHLTNSSETIAYSLTNRTNRLNPNHLTNGSETYKLKKKLCFKIRKLMGIRLNRNLLPKSDIKWYESQKLFETF